MALEYEESNRLNYIDWLRVLVVLTLIPFHASLTYLRYGVVYIKEPVSGLAALPFLIIEVPLGDFFMTLLFFVSGVASFYSFGSRGAWIYIGERAQKLMLPFGLGYFLLCPITAYIQALYEGFQGGFLLFLPHFFWHDIYHYHGYGHLWFLLYLFIFSVICVPLFRRWQRDKSHIERIGAFFIKGNRLLLPIFFIILLELFLRPVFHPDAFIIFGDWANVTVYMSLFLYGYVYAADSRIQEKVKEYFKPSIIFGALSLATLYYVNVNSQLLYSDAAYLTPLWVLSKGIYECAGILFLLNIGRLHLNRKSRVLTYLNRESFKIYIFHFLPVNFFTWIFIGFDMHLFAKYLIVVVLSYLSVFFLCKLLHPVFINPHR